MTDKLILAALSGRPLPRPPIWLMRQAGRYLPEYRAVRTDAGSFLDLCYNSEKATEVTLQPIRRFGLDAAILFADILLIPHALGMDVRFAEGEGPVMTPLRSGADLTRLDGSDIHRTLSPVYETVRRVKAALPASVALIGFCGAPWTVASYMVEGRGKSDFYELKKFAYTEPQAFQSLLRLIAEASVAYLSRQVDAGAEVVQIFESWAGAVPAGLLESCSIDPLRYLVGAFKKRHPDVPVIIFPRGTPNLDHYLGLMTEGVGLDESFAPGKRHLYDDGRICFQGHLDPALLKVGGAPMEEGARRLLDVHFRHEPERFIFNLGHGVMQHTPPEHVARLVEIVKGYRP